jgi:hypothetical protein
VSTELLKDIPREELMGELGRQMSAILEEATCCGWDYRIAEEVPRVCYAIVEKNKAGDFMLTPISLPLARWLVAMAEYLGHWVDSGGGGWKPYVPEAMKERRK